MLEFQSFALEKMNGTLRKTAVYMWNSLNITSFKEWILSVPVYFWLLSNISKHI